MTRRPSPQSRPRGGRRAKAPTLTTGRLSAVEVLRCQLTEVDRSAYPTEQEWLAATIVRGSAPVSTSRASRCVMTRVFPEPAPARTSIGPRS